MRLFSFRSWIMPVINGALVVSINEIFFHASIGVVITLSNVGFICGIIDKDVDPR